MKNADSVLQKIADYTVNRNIDNEEAYATARACFADSLGCAILSLQFPECTKLLGPVVPGTHVPNGSRVPGTEYILDPIQAAFNIGTMIRWLDYNDTWLAKEWGHPSDNLGGILATADFLCRNGNEVTVRDLLEAMIKAHEIQGSLALQNSFNQIGFDHVILVKVATAAVVSALLGASCDQVIDAISNAWIDTGPLRTYRHAPNTGSRKSWAAGDAAQRGVMFALMTIKGEMGYPQALSAKKWGLQDVLFDGHPLTLPDQLNSYVMENVLFKVAFPAEFHAQTAVECAFQLHDAVKNRVEEIDSVEIATHESAIRIIDKTGPLHNPADRDHCLQYMVAVGLLYGALTAEHYEDDAAQDPRIDAMRNKMRVHENVQYSRDYLDPEKRSIANAITITFKDGSFVGPVAIEYPIGHKRRRQEGIPLLFKKFESNLNKHFPEEQVKNILTVFENSLVFDCMPVSHVIDLFRLDHAQKN